MAIEDILVGLLENTVFKVALNNSMVGNTAGMPPTPAQLFGTQYNPVNVDGTTIPSPKRNDQVTVDAVTAQSPIRVDMHAMIRQQVVAPTRYGQQDVSPQLVTQHENDAFNYAVQPGPSVQTPGAYMNQATIGTTAQGINLPNPFAALFRFR
jgi:hypothetical protein